MKKEIIILISSIIIALEIGFIIGYKSVKIPTPETIIKTEYIKGDVITEQILVKTPPVTIPPDTLNILEACIESGLYTEVFPHDTVFQTTHDTVTVIITDWATKKHYEQTLWDTDTTGTCAVNVDIQYNDLQNLSYTYTPVTKSTVQNTVIVKERTFQPIVGAGILTNSSYTISAGAMFRERYGIMASYQHPFTNSKDYTFGLQALFMF